MRKREAFPGVEEGVRRGRAAAPPASAGPSGSRRTGPRRRLAALAGRHSEAMGVAVVVRDKELGLSVVAIHDLRN